MVVKDVHSVTVFVGDPNETVFVGEFRRARWQSR